MVCLGINYDEHAKEAGRFSEEAFGGQRPYTIYFSKRVSRLTGTGDPIPSYAGLVDSLDYEAELGVIIGKDARGVKARDAKDYIFGYTVVNDVSARNLQTRHKQWYLGKSLDGFAPTGPCIVTADIDLDPELTGKQGIVDGFTGNIYIEPDEVTAAVMEEKKKGFIKKFVNEFKAFALKGNVMDLAVNLLPIDRQSRIPYN